MSESLDLVYINNEWVPDFKVGFNKAVELSGVSRSTVNRDTKTGKLPSEGEPGARRYKVSDLQNLYGPLAQNRPVQESLVPESANPELHKVLAHLGESWLKQWQSDHQQNTAVLDELSRIRQLLEQQAEKSKLPWWRRWFH